MCINSSLAVLKPAPGVCSSEALLCLQLKLDECIKIIKTQATWFTNASRLLFFAFCSLLWRRLKQPRATGVCKCRRKVSLGTESLTCVELGTCLIIFLCSYALSATCPTCTCNTYRLWAPATTLTSVSGTQGNSSVFSLKLATFLDKPYHIIAQLMVKKTGATSTWWCKLLVLCSRKRKRQETRQVSVPSRHVELKKDLIETFK